MGLVGGDTLFTLVASFRNDGLISTFHQTNEFKFDRHKRTVAKSNQRNCGQPLVGEDEYDMRRKECQLPSGLKDQSFLSLTSAKSMNR